MRVVKWGVAGGGATASADIIFLKRSLQRGTATRENRTKQERWRGRGERGRRQGRRRNPNDLANLLRSKQPWQEKYLGLCHGISQHFTAVGREPRPRRPRVTVTRARRRDRGLVRVWCRAGDRAGGCGYISSVRAWIRAGVRDRGRQLVLCFALLRLKQL